MPRAAALIACLLLAQASWAGQLLLNNGDTIQGELKGIVGEEVVWQSDLLGEIKVNKKTILGIEAAEKLKIRGKDVPCVVESLADQHVMFACEDGDLQRFPFLALKQVVPFQGHATTNYSYSGNVRASGWKQVGNTNAEYWEVLGDINLRHGDWRHIFTLLYGAQSTESVNAQTGATVETHLHRAKGVYQLDWFFVPQWYWANSLSAATDDYINVQEEYIAASGLGYQVWESTAKSLALEGGFEYRRFYKNVNPDLDEPEVSPRVRLATQFRYQWTSGIRFNLDSVYSHSLRDQEAGMRERWEFRSDTGLNFPIGFGVSANVSATWHYINHARDLNPNAAHTDTIYRFGVNYSW